MTRAERTSIDEVAHCTCGAVSVVASGDVLSMFLCACEDCQRASGTGHAAAILMHTDAVSISGATRRHEVAAASGAMMSRWFCEECGMPLAARSSRAETVTSLPVGLFGAAASWFQPRHLLFARSLRQWDSIDPALPRHQTYPERESR